jgi:hypothetical protein
MSGVTAGEVVLSAAMVVAMATTTTTTRTMEATAPLAKVDAIKAGTAGEDGRIHRWLCRPQVALRRIRVEGWQLVFSRTLWSVGRRTMNKSDVANQVQASSSTVILAASGSMVPASDATGQQVNNETRYIPESSEQGANKNKGKPFLL